MGRLQDIPGYDAKATFYLNFAAEPVTYEMCYTAGECPDRNFERPEDFELPETMRGYHCWHRGGGYNGVPLADVAFCCHCNAERPPFPNEPGH